MTLRFSSSDNYSNSHDNLSWTVPQFADSIKNTKSISSADSFSLYNKVNGQFLAPLTIEQAQTAKQYKFLHNFLSRFLSVRLAHLRARACARKRAILPPSKTRAKKFHHHSALIIQTVAFILTVFSTMDGFAQIQTPQTPTFGGFQQVTPGQSYPTQNNNYNQQQNTNPYGAALQPKNADRMIQYNHKKDNEDILNEIKNEPGYSNPSAGNNFNQLTPEMRMEREMVNTLREVEYYSSELNEAQYYYSPKYLNDLPNYTKAKQKLKDMLEGKIPLSIKDAYYFSEAAYGNLQLSYEEYNKVIQDNANFIKQWLVENGYNPKDPEALHLGIQKFLSDTLYIGNNNPDNLSLSKQAHVPYYYDYIDYTSAEDRRNYFVTKTLATGTGQCHTLPTTYLILAEALGVKVYLSYNPVHSFIQYKNNKGTMLNYETTVDRFLPDQFYLETLPTMAKAKKNKIYMNSLNKKQNVATVMIDLAVNFVQEHWLSDKKFIKECMNTASPYFPEQGFINTANNYLNKRIYADTFNKKVKEKGIKNISDIEKYPDVLQAYNNYRSYMEKVSSLGIQDFPESEYIKMMEYYDTKKKLQTAKQIDTKSKKNLFFSY